MRVTADRTKKTTYEGFTLVRFYINKQWGYRTCLGIVIVGSSYAIKVNKRIVWRAPRCGEVVCACVLRRHVTSCRHLMSTKTGACSGSIRKRHDSFLLSNAFLKYNCERCDKSVLVLIIKRWSNMKYFKKVNYSNILCTPHSVGSCY